MVNTNEIPVSYGYHQCFACKKYKPIKKLTPGGYKICFDCDEAISKRVQNNVVNIKKEDVKRKYQPPKEAKAPEHKGLFPCEIAILKFLGKHPNESYLSQEIKAELTHYSPVYIEKALKLLVRKDRIKKAFSNKKGTKNLYSMTGFDDLVIERDTCLYYLTELFATNPNTVYSFEELLEHVSSKRYYTTEHIRNTLLKLTKAREVHKKKVSDSKPFYIFCARQELLELDERRNIKYRIKEYITKHPYCTNAQLQKDLSLSEPTIRNYTKAKSEFELHAYADKYSRRPFFFVFAEMDKEELRHQDWIRVR